MTRLLAKTTVLAFRGLVIAAGLSVTAFGSAGRKPELQQDSAPTELRVGADCTNTVEVCQPGTRCQPRQSGSRKWVCLPMAKVGEPCGPATGGCDDPAFCDDSLHCALGQAALGKACESHAECKAPLVCPWAKHVCSAPAKIGQSCNTNLGGRSECEPGSGCNGMRCVAQKADGQSCVADEECKAGVCQGNGCGRGAEPSFAERRGPAGD